MQKILRRKKINKPNQLESHSEFWNTKTNVSLPFIFHQQQNKKAEEEVERGQGEQPMDMKNTYSSTQAENKRKIPIILKFI